MAEGIPTLPVDFDPATTFIQDDSGHPVWPIFNRDQEEAIRQIVDVFGCRVESVSGNPGESRVSAEEVVSIGENISEDAQLYAHLTGRTWRHASNLDELRGAGPKPPEVVIASAACFTEQLLHEVYLIGLDSNDGGIPATGILAQQSGYSFREQILVRAAAAALKGSMKIRRIDFLPGLLLPNLFEQDREVLGGKATGTEVDAAISKGAGVLSIVTHSDGVDAMLGPDRTLCPLGRHTEHLETDLSPRCVETQYCHRHFGQLSQIRKTDFLVAVESIAARVMVFDVCYGILPSQSVLARDWGLGPQLIQSPKLGAILTTWEIVSSTPLRAWQFSELVSEGVDVGTALSKATHSPDLDCGVHRFCLFGDPKVSLPTSSVPTETQFQPIAPLRDRDNVTWQIRNDTSILKFLLARAPELGLNREQQELAEQAYGNIERYESAELLQENLEGGEDAPGPSARLSLMKYLLARDRMEFLSELHGLVKGRRIIVPHPPCRVCHTPTLSYDIPLFGETEARMVICAKCGFVQYARASWSAVFTTTNDNGFRLSGELPNESWLAVIHLRSDLPEESVHVAWPSSENGAPVERFRPPIKWPRGPLRATFILIQDAANVTMLGQMTRKSDRQTRNQRASIGG